MSWYLRVTDKRTGEVLEEERSGVSFANVDEARARSIVANMNQMDTFREYELRGNMGPRQTGFRFTPETAETIAKAELQRIASKRRPILFIGTPAMFKISKEI